MMGVTVVMVMTTLSFLQEDSLAPPIVGEQGGEPTEELSSIVKRDGDSRCKFCRALAIIDV